MDRQIKAATSKDFSEEMNKVKEVQMDLKQQEKHIGNLKQKNVYQRSQMAKAMKETNYADQITDLNK